MLSRIMSRLLCDLRKEGGSCLILITFGASAPSSDDETTIGSSGGSVFTSAGIEVAEVAVAGTDEVTTVAVADASTGVVVDGATTTGVGRSLDKPQPITSSPKVRGIVAGSSSSRSYKVFGMLRLKEGICDGGGDPAGITDPTASRISGVVAWVCGGVTPRGGEGVIMAELQQYSWVFQTEPWKWQK